MSDPVPYTISLPAKPVMAGCARMLTETLLGDDPRTSDAVAIIAEYFANSVLHSASGEGLGSNITIRLTQADDRLRIEVEDGGRRRTPAPPREGDWFGRGLVVVDGLATKWGHDSFARRGIAWAEI